MPCLVFRRRFTILKSVQYVRSFHKRTIVLVSWTSKDILIIFGECCTRMGSLVLWSCRQSRGLSRAVVPVLAHFLQESPPSPLFNLDSAVQMSPSNQSSWMLNAGWRVKGKSNTVKSGLAWIWVQCYSVRTAQPPSTFGCKSPKKMVDFWHFLLEERRLTQFANLYSCIFYELFFSHVIKHGSAALET